MSAKYLRMPWNWSTDIHLRRELSAEAFRTYVFATLWCGKEMTDGWIDKGQALEIVAHGDLDEREAIWDELVEFDLAVSAERQIRRRTIDGYELVEFLNEQQPASYWNDRKRQDAERQARSRARRKKSGTDEFSTLRSTSSGRSHTRSQTSNASGSSGGMSGGSDGLSWDTPAS